MLHNYRRKNNKLKKKLRPKSSPATKKLTKKNPVKVQNISKSLRIKKRCYNLINTINVEKINFFTFYCIRFALDPLSSPLMF